MTKSYHNNTQKTININLVKKAFPTARLTNKDSCMCLREDGMPKVDYYPGANTWRIVGVQPSTLINGSVEEFLEWYSNLTPTKENNV